MYERNDKYMLRGETLIPAGDPKINSSNNFKTDNILGEYDCVTKVRNYDFHDMPTKENELDELLPLLDLSAYVDKFHDSKKH